MTRHGGPAPNPPLGYAGGTTLSEVLQALGERGYRAEVVVEPGGRLGCRRCHNTADAGDFAVEATCRTEGASDPADMAIAFGLTCPSCGAACALALRYGPESDPDEADVLARLPAPA